MKRLSPGFWLVLSFLALVMTTSPSSAGTNILTNPGFESSGGSLDGWSVLLSGIQISNAGTDNIMRTGAAAAKMFGEFAGCPGPPTFSVGALKQTFASVSGKEYELSGYYYVSSADTILGTIQCASNRAVAKIAFLEVTTMGPNSDTTEVASQEVILGDVNTPFDQWLFFSISIPAPVSADLVEADLLFLQPDCDAGAVYLDDLSFCENPGVTETNLLTNPDFSTSLAGWITFEKVFHEPQAHLVRSPEGAAKLFTSSLVDLPSGMFQSFAASPGTAWKFTGHARSVCDDPVTGTNQNMATAKIVFRDGTDTEIGASETVLVDNASPLGTWTQFTLIAPDAPLGTVKVEAFILFISPALEAGAVWVDDLVFQELEQTGVPETRQPRNFTLHQNRPNPFSPSTRIDFELKEIAEVELSIYDISGRRVTRLFEGQLGPGGHHVVWNGTADNGARVATGIYRYVLKTSEGIVSRSMTLVN